MVIETGLKSIRGIGFYKFPIGIEIQRKPFFREEGRGRRE